MIEVGLGQTDALPVVVYLHGGGFICGTAELYNGDWLSVQGEITVITIGYRLAARGILSTGNGIEPGSFGSRGPSVDKPEHQSFRR